VIGQTISHYKILEKLGEGGMGVVYKAEDTKLERTVALKFLPAHLLGDDEVKKRFKREAKAAAALDHSNVCTVYEIDEADHKTFISMALIEGESLDKKIESGPLKLEDALDIAQQIAKGLEAAHNKGVVHRDIKPRHDHGLRLSATHPGQSANQARSDHGHDVLHEPRADRGFGY
jgi:serine/threonine protein kinase